jgi:hypothetical protein
VLTTSAVLVTRSSDVRPYVRLAIATWFDDKIDMDQETFKMMWELSETTAKDCFMRIEQTEYYDNPDTDTVALQWMPEVCATLSHFTRWYSYLALTVQEPKRQGHPCGVGLCTCHPVQHPDDRSTRLSQVAIVNLLISGWRSQESLSTRHITGCNRRILLHRRRRYRLRWPWCKIAR